MPESQLALSWDNFQQTMQSGIFHLLETEDLVDVTFCVEGKKLKAHKMILSVCSPFFKELFESNPCQHPIIFLNEVKFRIMKDLLTYMYKGEVLLTQELLPAFVRLGESLQIRGLTNDDSQPSNQSTNSPIDQQLISQRIFADSLPIHTAPNPKAASTPTIRRTMPRPTTAGIRRPAAISTASIASTPDSASAGHHVQMKRPRLAGNKTRFMLDSGHRGVKKVEKLEQEMEDGTEEEDAEDHLSNLEDIQQHNYSFTSTKSTSTTSKQRRKSTASTTSISSQPALPSATNVIDPMEMELAMIHQGQLGSKADDQQQDSEDGESQHETEQVIIGGDGGEVDIVLEQEVDEEGLQEDGDDMEEELIEHKLMMHTADGEVEIRGDDSIGGPGDEDNKDDDDIAIIRTVRKQEMPRYIVDGFVFHVNIMKGNPPMTYLRCLEYKRLGCHARAVMPTNGSIQDIQLTQMHNHPPDFAAEEKIVFMRELKDFLLRHMNLSTKEVYDLLQPIYPTAAHETPYDSIKNKMGRWKRSFVLDNELDMRLSGIETVLEPAEVRTPKRRSSKVELIIPN